jgi:pilus assembly protein CpaE
VTTVSSNLALALARRKPGRVVLAELGAGVPELALTLDLTPPHDLADLVGTADRLDANMLKRALVEHPARLSLLAHPAESLQGVSWDPPTVRQVLILLRAMFEFTVLDLGHAAGAAGDELAHLADQVLVVVGLDVPSLRLSRRLLRHLTDAGLPREKVQVVANRYGQSQQFPWRQAQEFLDRPVLEWVPDDPARVNAAMNQGQPLYLLGRSAITRCFDNLASQLHGPAQAYGDVG